jgi:hypothetical protein
MGVEPYSSYRTWGGNSLAIGEAQSFGASAWLIEVAGGGSSYAHTEHSYQDIVDKYYPRLLVIFVAMSEASEVIPTGSCYSEETSIGQDGCNIDYTCCCSGIPAPSAELTASIISPTSHRIKEGTNIVFDSSVSGGSQPYTYLWQYKESPSPTLFDMGTSKSVSKNDFTPGIYQVFLTITDSNGDVVYAPDDPNDPLSAGFHLDIYSRVSAIILLPSDGEVFEELDQIDFDAGFNGGDAPHTFSWSSDIDGELSTNVLRFSSRTLSSGTHVITFFVYDNTGDLATDSVTITVTRPLSVKAVISSPQNDEMFMYGQTVNFYSLAAGGTPPYTYSWVSSIDGNMGNIQNFNKNDLSPGDHTITLTVTDAPGASVSTSIVIHINPDNFTWTDKDGENWMTSVKSQGACGSCWAFATVASIEAKYNIQEDDPGLDIDLAEQYLVSDCCPGTTCSGGGNQGFFCVEDTGISEETCHDYQEKDILCPSSCDDASPIEFWNMGDFGFNTVRTTAAVQYNLIKNGPLYVQMNFRTFIDSGRRDPDGCVVYSCDLGLPNHAMVLTGYDNSKDYWILKNSWGSRFEVNGDPCQDGYYALDYSSCNIEEGIYAENISPP